MGITDQLLMAYVDGELAPDLASLILSRLETEPDLLDRMEQHRLLRRQLSATYEGVMAEPLPPSLAALVAEQGAALASALRRPAPALTFRRLGGAWPIWAVAAAALVGVGLSEARHAGDPITRSADGKLLASGPLARALEHKLAADAPAPGARIMASFQDRDSRYCRVFQGSGHEDGVACKSGGRWQVVALAASTGAPPPVAATTTYRQASSALAPSLAAAVDELQGADALTQDQERQARTQQWQVRGKAGPKAF
jgi:hypothetical protein